MHVREVAESDRTARPPTTAERLDMLATSPILRGLPFAVLRDIDAALDSIHVMGGALVVKRGQAHVPLILVAQGGLRGSFVDGSGRRHALLECFRGGTAGETLVLSGRPSPLDLHAIRDSHLLCLAPEQFARLAVRHPELALSFGRFVSGHLAELVESPEVLGAFADRAGRFPRSIALLSMGGEQARRTRVVVADALAQARTTTRLSIREAREAIGAQSASRYARLMEWLDGIDAPSELVVFECDREDSAWLDFCLRQADRVMVLLDGGPQPSAVTLDGWRDAKLGERAAQLELALVHPTSCELPCGGAAHAELPGVRRLHHVRSGDRPDADRLARWLLDRPVGLVFGGGGAYGIAHVGVLRALEEARVPVDIVGGTSMGAIFAGGLARGWSADRIMAEVRSLFASRFALYDLTIPYSSLLGGRKLDRVLGGLFEGLLISDLWTPFFCVSTNISRARPELHDSGDLRGAIRSSCSIPGLFPPYRTGEQLLVDGGLINNLPIGEMSERCRGPIIAVDVFPYQRPKSDFGGRSRRGLFGLLARLEPLSQMAPPLFEILMQSTFVGSQRTTEMSLSRRPPALHLIPQLGQFGILDWRAHEAICRAGYDSAKRELDAGTLPRSLWEGHIEDPG